MTEDQLDAMAGSDTLRYLATSFGVTRNNKHNDFLSSPPVVLRMCLHLPCTLLRNSFDMLSSSCLKENLWHKFPFTGFVAMLSAIITLMVDSMATSIYSKKNKAGVLPETQGDQEMAVVHTGHSHGHHHYGSKLDVEGSQLLHYRVIAMVLEFGIIVHSIVIGLSLGASNNICTIKGLVAALCFHQMFEGMGPGGCILQGITLTSEPFPEVNSTMDYLKRKRPSCLDYCWFAERLVSSPFGLHGLVDLLATDFTGPKLQGSIKLQIKSYMAVLLGAGGMSLMAKWA
ncbi:unnamed protein product [Fraxinus pennsylvanica]|uniref:Uncharacterized protein n=1 Tax=Fraxinus pennsylvanica TaxID=56036 RepID=A0AAD2A9B0_9LAMI|nr:unnamed protein product [Fraxinus pennsylvanica]